MHLEVTVLSEINQRETQIPHDFTYMWKLKNKANEHTNQNKNSQIQRTAQRRRGLGSARRVKAVQTHAEGWKLYLLW